MGERRECVGEPMRASERLYVIVPGVSLPSTCVFMEMAMMSEKLKQKKKIKRTSKSWSLSHDLCKRVSAMYGKLRS